MKLHWGYIVAGCCLVAIIQEISGHHDSGEVWIVGALVIMRCHRDEKE